MEETRSLTEDELQEARRIRDEIVLGFGASPSQRQKFTIRSVDEAFNSNDLDLLRLYEKYLPAYQPYNIRNALKAQIAFGVDRPAESVTPDVMAVAHRFYTVLVEERGEKFTAVDSQSYTFLTRYVLSHPEDLELVLSILTEGRAIGYTEVLNVLPEMKSQGAPSAFTSGIL